VGLTALCCPRTGRCQLGSSELGGLWEAPACPQELRQHPSSRHLWQRLCLPVTAHWLCCSLREVLVQCGKEHQKDRTVPKHYVPYLLAMLNNNLALR